MTDNVVPTASKKTFGILSLVFGIISIVFSWILPIIWIILAILAVVFGFLSRRQEPSARVIATVGIVLGFIGIVANIASMVIGATIAAQMLNG